MADRSTNAMNGGKDTMNGQRLSNGVSKSKSPLPLANGNSATNATINSSTKGPTEQGFLPRVLEKQVAATNGVMPLQPVSDIPFDMDQLPDEILEMVRGIPDEAYVPMSRLVNRSAQTCWSDLTRLIHELDTIILQDPKDVKDRIAGEIGTPNDTSEANRTKKYKLWNFAESHKRSLIKLLVLLQWSANTEENKVTIALNFYFHAIRAAFTDANNRLDEWIYYVNRRQDAAPDLHTAAEMLATGRLMNLPDLGYVQEVDLTSKEMLSALRRLDSILYIRMLSEDNLPPPFTKWRVHDGRVTFNVPGEFDISLSLTSEDENAKFQVVDVQFKFHPMPVMSQGLLDEILRILNDQLWDKGLEGAYQFLHDLTLTQKLKEMNRQALVSEQSSWAGNIRIELHKRVLVVQYWTRRSSPKSWIEIIISSGRINPSGELAKYPIPYLSLRWLKHGKLVRDHPVQMDLDILSFENVLNEVIACHINSVMDAIYDKLAVMTLYSTGQLELEQSTSITDGSDCNLSVQLSKIEQIELTCDPVGGALIVSPAGERTNRLQAELAKSKNLVEDFVGRFVALRCSITQAVLSKAINKSTWRSLPGRKPSLLEVEAMFSPSTIRAAFFRQQSWSSDWMLVASFGIDGDFWWLAHDPENAKPALQKMQIGPIHQQSSLTSKYFEFMARHAAVTISLQTCLLFTERHNIKSIIPALSSSRKPSVSIQLSTEQGLNTFGRDCVIAICNSPSTPSRYTLTALVKSAVPSQILRLLAAAKLESYITVDAENKVVRIEINHVVGEDKMADIMNRLRYINDVTNCIGLVHDIRGYCIQRLSSSDIVIDYHTSPHMTLSLTLSLGEAIAKSRPRLLPDRLNPHLILANKIEEQFLEDRSSLAERLKSLLSILTMTLPMVSSLHYIQGMLSAREVPEMGSLDLADSGKWLRVHVIPRNMVHFAVHYFANDSGFKRRDDVRELPAKLLVRLEIEPQISSAGSVVAWIVRPAIEEFESYLRPSFSSQELKQYLQEAIFSSVGQRWTGEDNAARISILAPYQFMIKLHETILGRLKEAIKQHTNEPAPTQQPLTANAATKLNGLAATNPPNPLPKKPQALQTPPSQPLNRQLTQQQQQQLMMQSRQRQMQQQAKPFQPGRPQNMNANMNLTNMQHGQNAGMGMNPSLAMNPNSNGNGTSRVMTAQPQQVRQMPANAGRGRGQSVNMQNRQQNRQAPLPHQVINLD